MTDLADRDCIPAQKGEPRLVGDDLARLQSELGSSWTVVDGHHLEKTFKFTDFRQALHFANLIGELAEEVNHHPEIFLTWGKVGIKLWTHRIDGLSEADFVWAARADRLA